MDLFDLTDRVALVTGGGRGLGKGMASALAAAGAHVVIASRTKLELEAALSDLQTAGAKGEHSMQVCDVGNLDSLAESVDRTAERYGGLDILVNAAAVQLRKPSLEVTPADYDRVMAVNLRAAYFASQFAARAMIKGGRGGKIIQIASLGTSIGLPNVSIYTAAKSGLAGMLRTMALEWAPLNIQVNAIAPGYFRTELTEPLLQDPQRRAALTSRIPSGRFGAPEDLAGITLFLASGASDYVTGQVMYVDGGWTAG